MKDPIRPEAKDGSRNLKSIGADGDDHRRSRKDSLCDRTGTGDRKKSKRVYDRRRTGKI